jgi:hypothetical protein
VKASKAGRVVGGNGFDLVVVRFALRCVQRRADGVVGVDDVGDELGGVVDLLSPRALDALVDAGKVLDDQVQRMRLRQR